MNTNQELSLFERLNQPFPYADYQYDSFNDRCYISGQAITERLNEVLGVGFWKYRGLYDTEKMISDSSGKQTRVKVYVEFSFYNTELKEWITFIDAGSEQIKAGMNEGDATKSAITDGMKKCASRLGIASDLYKGLITWDKQQKCMIVPESYQAYYQAHDILPPIQQTLAGKTATRKAGLTTKLQQRPSSTSTQNKMKTIWNTLAGSLDGFQEWYDKKKQEKLSEDQMLELLNRRMKGRKTATIA